MVKGKLNTRVFDIVTNVFMLIFMLLMVYPLWYCFVNSLSDSNQVYYGNVTLFIKGFTFDNYISVFKEDSIVLGFTNTIFYTAVGTIVGLFVTFTAAYPLSRQDLYGKSILVKLYLLPMFISGGLVPTFLLVKSLGLYDSFLALILPGAVGVWNVIVVRTYIINSIPKELEEASMLDGAGNIKIFTMIIIPLCKPILAVMLMFHVVGYWNTYFNALIYLNDENKYPIQLVLRKVLLQDDVSSMIGSGNVSADMMEQAIKSEALKYASIIITTIPMLIIYPIFEKYFDKGMVIGSLKG